MEITREYAKGDKFPYHYKYEHMAVTADCVIFSYDGTDLQLLLIRRGVEPYKGMWALPGGFLKMNETAKEGAFRELHEETGFVASYLEEFGTFSGVHRDPRERTITIAFVALVMKQEVRGGDDAQEARWFPVSDLPALAFDHLDIYKAAREYLRRAICFEPIGFELMGEEFTIPSLQHLYETILERKFDRGNFQKKLLSLGLLESTEKPSDRDESGDLYSKDEIKINPPFSAPSFNAYISAREDSFSPRGKGLARKPIEALFEEKEESAPKPKGWSRKVIKYRFNRAVYDRLKKKGNKIEF